MALEDLTGSTKYIDSLVETNPVSGDPKSEGDDHIRGLKNVLKNTAPNIAGPITASHGDLSACTNFEETISATTSEVSINTTKTLNITDVGALKIASTAVTTTAAELNKLDGATPTTAEINTLSGVTSAIQAQMDTKTSTSHDHNGGDGAQIPTGGIADSAVTSAKIANGTITGTDIASATVTGSNMANGTVDTTQLAADCINGSKINWTFTTAFTQVVSSSGSWTPTTGGIYTAVAVEGLGTIKMSINDGSTWRQCTYAFDCGSFISDGSNIRFNEVSGSGDVTIYYRLLA